MRSKQWYTKISRLENSLANNSIGRLLDFALATRSSDRRPVESNTRGAPGERRWITGEKEAGRRELASGRARFPERPRGARPVSAERPQAPAKPDQNSGDFGPRPCGIYRAAIQSGALPQSATGLHATLAYPRKRLHGCRHRHGNPASSTVGIALLGNFKYVWLALVLVPGFRIGSGLTFNQRHFRP